LPPLGDALTSELLFALDNEKGRQASEFGIKSALVESLEKRAVVPTYPSCPRNYIITL